MDADSDILCDRSIKTDEYICSRVSYDDHKEQRKADRRRRAYFTHGNFYEFS